MDGPVSGRTRVKYARVTFDNFTRDQINLDAEDTALVVGLLRASNRPVRKARIRFDGEGAGVLEAAFCTSFELAETIEMMAGGAS
jgi:hypothetical protein